VPAAIAEAAEAERKAKVNKEDRRFFGYLSSSSSPSQLLFFLLLFLVDACESGRGGRRQDW
jgi:hypothetical protein